MTDGMTPIQGISVQIHPLTMSELHHAEAFELAYKKFVERNKVYKDLWKDDDIEGTIAHIKHKAMRVGRMTDQEAVLDDAIDLVNYSLFLLRLVESERFTIEPPKTEFSLGEQFKEA